MISYIPYATPAHAFQSLDRRPLGKSEADLRSWRAQLQQALDPNGSLIVDPSRIETHNRPAAAGPDLPPQAAQNRSQPVFRRFINVFARPEHTLAVLLDDLQWLDVATLDKAVEMKVNFYLAHLKRSA
jgi:predicted ATPase